MSCFLSVVYLNVCCVMLGVCCFSSGVWCFLLSSVDVVVGVCCALLLDCCRLCVVPLCHVTCFLAVARCSCAVCYLVCVV